MQDRFLSGIESSKLHFKIVWIKSIEWSNSIVYKSNRFLSTTYVHSSFFMLMYENICTSTYIYYMAFYAHFSQVFFYILMLVVCTPFWLLARQTFVALKFVLVTFANQKCGRTNNCLDIFSGEKLYYCLIENMNAGLL